MTEHVQVDIEEEYDEELRKLCDAEIAEKVKKPVTTYKETGKVGFHTGGRWFDEDFFGKTYEVDGTLRKEQPSLLLEGEEMANDAESKVIEDYYDRLEELESEVSDAVDEATLSVATKVLWEHKQKGIKLGL
jgi:hypothetical protein